MLCAMRTALFTSLFVLALSTPTTFRGCGEDPPPDVVLPPTPPDAGVCAVDDDCPNDDACADIRCLAGACTLVARVVDRDLDGEAAAPCGSDCDDGDRRVFPGAAELCNGFDDDCDGVVDDDAPPTVSNRSVASLTPASALVRVGDALFVTVDGDARPIDRYGRLGMTFDVLAHEGPVSQTETATAPDGRALVASIVEGGTALEYAVLSPGTPPNAVPGIDIAVADGALDLAVVAHRGSFAMAWLWLDTVGVANLSIKADITSTDAPFEIAALVGVATIASDGVSLFFAEGDEQLGVLSAGGVHTTLALGGNTLRHGLASGDGFVVALTLRGTTAMQAYLTRVDASAGLGAPVAVLYTAEGLALSDETRLARVGDGYLVARSGNYDLRVTQVNADLSTTLPDVAFARASSRSRISTAALPGFVAVLNATPSSSAASDVVLITSCGAAP